MASTDSTTNLSETCNVFGITSAESLTYLFLSSKQTLLIAFVLRALCELSFSKQGFSIRPKCIVFLWTSQVGFWKVIELTIEKNPEIIDQRYGRDDLLSSSGTKKHFNDDDVRDTITLWLFLMICISKVTSKMVFNQYNKHCTVSIEPIDPIKAAQ